MEYKVGTIIRLKMPCLENQPGTLGVCYEHYKIGKHEGWSFIFPNGMYDGFSNDDIDMICQYEGFDENISKYQFTNVGQLKKDFDAGKFDFKWKLSRRWR